MPLENTSCESFRLAEPIEWHNIEPDNDGPTNEPSFRWCYHLSEEILQWDICLLHASKHFKEYSSHRKDGLKF